MKKPEYIPEIRHSVFWDVTIEGDDYTAYSDFVIVRVFNYGNFREIADVVVSYGKDYVKEVLQSTIDLNIFGLDKASAFLGIPEQNFKCYERKPFPLSS